MHPRLTELVHYADAQRAALLAAAAALPDARWSERPAPDVWAVSDVCEHLHRVERGCARLIAARAAEAQAANHSAETSTSTVLDRLDAARITDRSTPVQAPDRVAPEGGWTRSAALDALARSRAELHAAMQAADGLALETVRAEHPRLGDIDLYQWMLFVAQHEARHVPQVTEIVTRLGSTRSDASSS